MMEIFSLVSHFFMTEGYFPFLLCIIAASFFTMGQFPLLFCQFFFCFSKVFWIRTFCSIRKYCHPLHGIINSQYFCFLCLYGRCLVFALCTLIQNTGKIFSCGFLTYGYGFHYIFFWNLSMDTNRYPAKFRQF